MLENVDISMVMGLAEKGGYKMKKRNIILINIASNKIDKITT